MNVGFDVSNIGKGILNNNIPSADTAVKIAKFLNTTTEYLVTGIDSSQQFNQNIDLDELIKYSNIIHCLDSIPSIPRKPIEIMIKELSSTYSKTSTESE